MRIKYLRAQNFMAVKDKPFEIDFTKYGNIIQIIGVNHDYGDGHSNSSGKSTIFEAIVYGFYGKLIKGLNHTQAINVFTKSDLEVEIHFDIGEDKYRIIRKREPNALEFWKGDQDLTLGGIPATQNEINNIIGLGCDAFCNIVVFGQHNEKGFLSSTAAEKRAIAENLLSLDKYVKYHKLATEKKKSVLAKVAKNRTWYEASLDEQSKSHRRKEMLSGQEKQWSRTHFEEVLKIKSQIELNESRFVPAPQIEIKSLDDDIVRHEEERKKVTVSLNKVDELIATRRSDKQEIQIDISNLEREKVILSKSIEELEIANKEAFQIRGAKCPLCWNDVGEDKVRLIIDHNRSEISVKQDAWNKAQSKIKQLKEDLAAKEDNLKNLLDGRNKAREREMAILAEFNRAVDRRTELSKGGASAMLVKRDIDHLKERLKHKEDETNPYSTLVEQAQVELLAADAKVEEYKLAILADEEMIPYYDFWLRAFGDEGIRSFVLTEIIPALNNRINYRLQYLIDNNIEICFTNQLEAKIKKQQGGDNLFVYNCLSGGDHQRVDLAISLAFADVMTLTSGACPSIIALDEIGTNLDRPGIHAIYKTICELSKERQVLVTTHHPELQELLSSYETIEVEMRDGVTTIRK